MFRKFLLLFLFCSPISADTVVLDFEGFAPDGAIQFVTPFEPYTEDEFIISTLANDLATAVFDSENVNADQFFGAGDSDFIAFASRDALTLSHEDNEVFALNSLLAGPFFTQPVDLVLNGLLSDGSSVTASFNGLTTATVINLNWNNLVSVEIAEGSFPKNVDSIAIDNVVINQVPEPSCGLLAVLSILLVCRRRNSQLSLLD